MVSKTIRCKVPVSASEDIEEDVPVTHDNEAFWEAWRGFVQHRTSKAFKKYPFTAIGARSAFRKLTKVSCKDAIAMIETACELGWRGIWPIKPVANGHTTEIPKWGNHQ